MNIRGWLIVLGALAAAGCDVHTTNLISRGADASTVAPPGDAGRVDAAQPMLDAAQPMLDAGAPTSCRGMMACACDNGVDDDFDGLIDGLDPECTGALDNDERTFATGEDAPRGSCLDCFFDGDPGVGDNGCAYPKECLEGRTPKPSVDSTCSECTVTLECQQACLPSTPNGCDCFGCCEIRREDGSRVDVALTKECSLAYLDDPRKCPRCVPTPSCKNECGQCELCPGQTEADLPEVCHGASSDAGVPHACDDGSQPCDANTPCSEVYYCQQGCCLPRLQ